MLKIYGGLGWALAIVLVCFCAYNKAINVPPYMRVPNDDMKSLLEANTTEKLQEVLRTGNVTYNNLAITEVKLTIKETFLDEMNAYLKWQKNIIEERITKHLEYEFKVLLKNYAGVKNAQAKVIEIRKTDETSVANYDAVVRVASTGVDKSVMSTVYRSFPTSFSSIQVIKMRFHDVPFELPGMKYEFINSTRSFYKIHAIARTWPEAKEQCVAEGAFLWFPEDQAEADAVFKWWSQTQPFKIYVGISDLKSEGHFETVDGRPAEDVYTNWGPGEPNNISGKEDCALLHGEEGTLNDDTCNHKYPFICKAALTAQIKNALVRKEYEFINSTQCFYKFYYDLTWHEAKNRCVEEGASLWFPEDQAEADAVFEWWNQNLQMRRQLHVYIGISDQNSTGVFKTIDGRPLNDVFNKWGPGEPNNPIGGKEDCGVLRLKTMYQNDVDCSKPYPYICKKYINDLH